MDDNMILVENKLASLFAAAALSVAGAHGGTKPHTNSGVPTPPPLIEKPVVKAKDGGFLQPSIQALTDYLSKAEKLHGSLFGKQAEYTFGEDDSFSIDDLVAALKKHVEV